MPKPPSMPTHTQLPEKIVQVKTGSEPTVKKSKKEDSWKVLVRIRSYEGSNMVDVWILKVEGPASSCLLWGQMFADAAVLLVEKLGADVECEYRPYAFVPSMFCISQTLSRMPFPV